MPDSSVLIDRLQKGNRRFVDDTTQPRLNEPVRNELASGQSPFAVVVGCADSRVPPEIVFDQGLGDLFVIRVAGHVVGPTEADSIKYAVDVLGTKLVIVLGHTNCGAVQATIDHLSAPLDGFEALTSAIAPNIAETIAHSNGDICNEAVRAHIAATVTSLASEFPSATVCGAVYNLESGAVEFI